MPHQMRFPRWTDEEDARLLRRFSEGAGVEVLAEELQRSEEDIRTRLRLWLPTWDGSRPKAPSYRVVEGLRLRILGAGAYEYQGQRVDYHIARDGATWRVDAFDSAIRDDHDRAHLGSDERPTLREVAEDIREGMLDHRAPKPIRYACAHPGCATSGKPGSMRRARGAWYCRLHAPTLRSLLLSARGQTGSREVRASLDEALALLAEQDAALQSLVDALHRLRKMATRIGLDESEEEAAESLPELGQAERALQHAAHLGIVPTPRKTARKGGP